MYRFTQSGYTKVTNYLGNKNFELAKMNASDIYIAMGQRGVLFYKYQNDKLILHHNISFYMEEKNNKRIELQITDIEYDSDTQTYYFIDKEEGLKYISVD